MARVTVSKKSCAVNPLKMSQPIGGALAFMGVSGCMPVLHGSQGCTSFGLVLFVRHFKEAIPLQTTAMNEVATVLGGLENIEQAILNIVKRAKPQVIGICSTGVTETKGDDVDGYLQLVRKRHPELDDIGMVYVSTPDFKDAFQDGFGKTVTKLIETFVPDEIPSRRAPQRVNVLAGCHLTPGDIDELRDIIEAFGLEPTFLPDLSGSLDGHIPDDFTPTTLGGVTKEDIAAMGSAAWTIAVGEQMRAAAELLQKRAGVRYELFDRLTGLAPNDELIGLLSRISGRPVPIKFRRQRGQLVDAMLDGHFHFGGKRVAIGAEPDLLFAISQWLTEMGAEVTAAVTTTHSPVLEKIMTEEVLIGDLEDLENRLAGCDLMITHSHGRQASERSGVPLYRMGLPMFDRIGAAHELSVGYRGTRDLIFKLGNLFIHQVPEPTTETWRGESAEHDGTTLASENDIAPISAH
ncbi:nitrogenase iron-molybdenum cofactor biosynthesis protein NifN [Methylocystis iwaonis]|uniref:nitrogenase iron-molybdenum cofactor biosynthesis protein NifN n=1 Tax=Methylocystis iwaonis TaxID=2885079 RepID=UPI002E7B4234|nr:nitrogenase iron-molybdenum cofactor biosynthesis protein NifN [Methylocystis iwaonis]